MTDFILRYLVILIHLFQLTILISRELWEMSFNPDQYQRSSLKSTE